jgi:hypothetical protein
LILFQAALAAVAPTGDTMMVNALLERILDQVMMVSLEMTSVLSNVIRDTLCVTDLSACPPVRRARFVAQRHKK